MGAKKRNMKRRCVQHNYRSRCIYLITLNKADYIPEFSQVYGNPDLGRNACGVKYAPLGFLIVRELRNITLQFHHSRILQYKVMPYHLHFVLFIEADVEYHIGELISRFTGNCTRANNLQPIFAEGYNDKIVSREGQLNRMINYVADNPRRYMLRKLHPEFFVSRFSVPIEGRIYQAYGNPLLLEHPVIRQVRFSRRFTALELKQKMAGWDEAIRHSGGLLSPFLHPTERAVRDKAFGEGASLIYFTKEQFGERDKPSGQYFDLCAEGRLILISLGEEALPGVDISRVEAMRMNYLCEKLLLLLQC